MAENILMGAAGRVESATTSLEAAPRWVEVAFVQLRQEDCQRPKARSPGSLYSRGVQWLIERQERLVTRREELAGRHRRTGHTCRRALPADHLHVETSAHNCLSASAVSGKSPRRLSQRGRVCSSGTVDAGIRLHNEAQERMARRHERTEAYFRKICRCPCTPSRSTAVLRRRFERRALEFTTGGEITFEDLQALCRDLFPGSDSISAMAAAAVWDVSVDHSFVNEAQVEVILHTDGRTEIDVDVEQLAERLLMENEEPHEAGESQTDEQVCIPESNSDDGMPVAQFIEACLVHDRGAHASVSTCLVQEREVVEGEVATNSRQMGSLATSPETRPLEVVIERLLHIRSSPYLLHGDAAAREKRKCAAAATAETTCHGLSCWKQPAEGTRWLQKWGRRQAMKVFEILRPPGGMSKPAWHSAVGVLATAAGLKVDVRTLAEETWACLLTGQVGRAAELTAASFAKTVLPAVTHALTKPGGDLRLVMSNDSTAVIDTIARAVIDVVSKAGFKRLEEELAKARPLPPTRTPSPPTPTPMSNSERSQRRQRQMEQLRKFEHWHSVVREEKDARAAEARAARLKDELAECTFAPRVRRSKSSFYHGAQQHRRGLSRNKLT